MKTKILRGLSIFALPLTLADAQCIRFQTDKNGPCEESSCETFCGRSAVMGQSANRYPGFSLQQQGGKLVVSGVVPNSPAAMAGVRTGDELVSVDSIPAPFTGESSVWGKSEFHTVRLSRAGVPFGATLASAPVEEILANLPIEREFLRNAALWPEGRQASNVGLFMSGMTVHREGPSFIVDTVLRGSPAYWADLHPGDRFDTSGWISPEWLESASERLTVNLRVLFDGGTVTRAVRFASLTEIMDALSTR